MNKKGFAISTMLYGLIFVTIAIFYLLITIVNNRTQSVSDYATEARDSIKKLDE